MIKENKLFVSELIKEFSKSISFRKAKLRKFYQSRLVKFDDNVFRRILYALEKERIIVKVDTGTYALGKNNVKPFNMRKIFEPSFSLELKEIDKSLKSDFPYTNYCVWETRVLYEFMVHQPARNLSVVEVEKEATEAIFNHLSDHFPGKVFLDPSREIVENYALRLSDSIIVLPMISRSPTRLIQGISFPFLEKILVDLFVDEDRFFLFHGQELINIFETAFETYKISERKLLWYAQRRHAKKQIRKFIDEKTEVHLLQTWETEE